MSHLKQRRIKIKMIPQLTEEQKQEYFNLIKIIDEGRLYRVCSKCSNFYLISRENFGTNICKNCLNGVKISTF